MKANNKLRIQTLTLFAGLLHMVTGVIADDSVYSFGIVPQFPAQRIHTIWQPILAELEKRTHLKFKLTGSPTIPAFERQFLAGEFDFAYMNPYHVVKASKSHQYRPIARDVGRSLYGIIVVKKDSAVKDVKQLQGKTVAFPAPNAVGASLIPRADLRNRYNVTVNPRYVQSHSSVYLNVALGRVAAGGGVQKTLEKQDAAIKNKLRVIYQTKQFAPHPIVAHSRIPDKHLQLVKNALLEMGKTAEGKKLFSQIPIKNIGPARLKDYQPLKHLNLEKFYHQE